jgi:hypothetical protein
MIWFAKNLIVTRAAARAIVLHRPAGEEACCLDLLYLFLPQVKDVHVDSVSAEDGGADPSSKDRHRADQ